MLPCLPLLLPPQPVELRLLLLLLLMLLLLVCTQLALLRWRQLHAQADRRCL
jgi:hypothetical protein